MAYAFFLPAVHVVLCVFVPGLPPGVKFPKMTWNFKKVTRNRGLEIEEQYEDEIDLEMIDISRFRGRGRLSREQDEAFRENLSGRETLIRDFYYNHNEVPSFVRVISMMVMELCRLDFKHTRDYFYTMGWKLGCLLKMTIGYWDDDMVRGFKVMKRVQVFDDDLEDTESYHVEMLGLLGQSHSLVWQFFHSTVMVAKLAEAMNRSPLFIVTKEEKLHVDPLWADYLTEETTTMPPCYRKLYNLYLLFGGRIFSTVFDFVSFGAEVALVVYPSVPVVLVYWALILPDRLVETFDRWTEMEVQTPYLSKVMRCWGWWFSKIPYSFIIFTQVNGLLIGLFVGITFSAALKYVVFPLMEGNLDF
jgi:hypothetical protein